GFERRTQVLDEGLPGWTLNRCDIAHASAGEWHVRITAPQASPFANPAAGFLLASTSSSIAISAHVTSLATLSEREIGIAAHLYDSKGADSRTPLVEIAQSGVVFLETVSGSRQIEMFDDGDHD